jgi:hypothetical protein
MSRDPQPLGPHGAIHFTETETGVCISQADREGGAAICLSGGEAAHLLRLLGARASRIAAEGDEPVCAIDLVVRTSAASALWARSKTMPQPTQLDADRAVITISTATMRRLLDQVIDEHNDPTVSDALERLAEGGE